ncbi:MAG: hypothetical protein JW828_09540 [Sedimentisphaerales bacterium]|nr:hypothetical protein [Sedimentisphaerales bacterium]
MARRTIHTVSVFCFCSILGIGLMTGWSAITTGQQGSSAGSLSLIETTSNRIVVEFRPPARNTGLLEAELYNLEGHLLAKVTRSHNGQALQVTFVAEIDRKNPANYYVRFRFGSNEAFQQRSLYYASPVLETIVLGQREFLAGTRPVIRILVKDRAAAAPIQGAQVSVELTDQDQIISKFTARTDQNGEVSAPLDTPEAPVKDAKLRIHVVSETAEDNIEETIQVRSAVRTLLTTDKPLYQPGQTIHIRALTLSQPTMKSLADADVTFEVEDAKGNKVFKTHQKTDAYGISHTDFILANELNMGTYRIRAIAAGMKEEKTVTVQRYVLPKFKIETKTDRQFYQPGDTVRGQIQADYFFGKPVASGKVQIKCSAFDVAYTDFQEIEGKTDDTGHYTFEVKLPTHFVGQPLEAGKASAKFEIAVIDTADHKETITKNVTVTASPILIAAVPESGALIPDLENRIYIIATYADATAAACKVVWENAPQGTMAKETDEAGFAEILVTPQAGQTISMTLTARDNKGQTGKASIELKSQDPKDDDSILLRSDKSLYRVGQEARFAISSTRKTGTVYLDVIKDRQTYLTKTLELQNSQSEARLTWDANLAGTVQINAYFIGRNGVVVRDRRLVLVDPSNDLQIAIRGDQETYLPAGEAKLHFTVTDQRGNGIASALGVMVVDEAVFALQEIQPGLEKIYFYLEKEIATPRYEIHGYELDQCISTPGPLPRVEPADAHRDKAARALLASAKGVGEYSLHINSYQKDKKEQAFQEQMTKLLQPNYAKIAKALNEYSNKHRNDRQKRTQGLTLSELIQDRFLDSKAIQDPWGTEMKLTGQWCQSCQTYHGFILASAGIDTRWDTMDDVTLPHPDMAGQLGEDGRIFLFARRAAAGGRVEADFAMAMPEKAMPAAALMDAGTGIREKEGVQASSGLESQEPIRIREYFPETLYFNPAVITDPRGTASLSIPLADSITTWRASCMASSVLGQLGSATAGIRVFQDFFVDIDFPVALTQNDKVHVPVAIYNYLKTDQEIRLQVTEEDWFELEGLAEKTVTLAPAEIRAVYFPITAKKVGFRKFTVTARGTKKSDAVARQVEIVPDGAEILISHSGRLEGATTHTITIPEKAIEDASTIFVKVYPGVLSQVAEGLDSMLRMPFGCFEQTSSVTYPNILVLDYMKTTGKITPELQMKAEGFINAGYQRLVSYEVEGGGFEWFGKAPAHRILTAYGLMEFYDMSKVYEVDPAIIDRTQKWLAACQEKDGSYKPSGGGIQEGAINKFTDDILRNTAYITWALAATGYEGSEVGKGIQYIKNHLDAMKDVYTRVLVVNALAAVDPKGKTTMETLRTLHEMRVEEGQIVFWKAQSETPTCGTGKTADIETTALAIQAFIRCGQELGTVSKAVTFLVKNKDAYGTWQSTQATIQALRAMLMAERGATAITEGTIDVVFNDETIHTLKINEDNSDVLQLVDLKDRTRKGNHTITLDFKGKGSLLYQAVGRYFLPRPDRILPIRQEPMTITVDYDRTELATQDIITATATVTNNRSGKAKMVIMDLGLPPGFTLMPEKLNDLVEKQAIEKYSTTGRQIILYLREVNHNEPVTIQYQLVAKYPLRAKTPVSAVYEYYNPEIRSEARPIQLVVAQSEAKP